MDENRGQAHSRYLTLADGRLLTCSQRPADDHVTHFQVSIDRTTGRHGRFVSQGWAAANEGHTHGSWLHVEYLAGE